MDMNFCRRCGSSLTNTERHIYHCAKGHTLYLNANPTVGLFLFNESGDVLLARRGIEPNKGMLDSFGGFLDGSESFEDAITREMQEELSLEPNEYGPLHFIASSPASYELDGEHIPLVGCMFWARLLTKRVLTPSDDVAEIVTMPMLDVNEAELHNDDIIHAVKILKDMKRQDLL